MTVSSSFSALLYDQLREPSNQEPLLARDAAARAFGTGALPGGPGPAAPPSGGFGSGAVPSGFGTGGGFGSGAVPPGLGTGGFGSGFGSGAVPHLGTSGFGFAV